MIKNYELSFTAEDINEKLGSIKIEHTTNEAMNRIDLTKEAIETGFFMNSGNIANTGNYANYSVTRDYRSIDPVTDKLFIYFNNDGVTTTVQVAFYTNENAFISTSLISTTTGTLESYTHGDKTYNGYFFDIPENAGKYRINIATAYFTSFTNFYHISPTVKPTVCIPNLAKPFNGMKILNLGDSIFGHDRTDNISSYLAEYTGATVYNGGFGGTLLSERVDESSPYIWFDGLHLVEALTTGDWTNQDANVNSDSITISYYPEALTALKSIDMSKIDIITLAWGTNDYAGNCSLEKITGALETIIDMLQEAYPEIRLLVCTPIWRYFEDGTDGDTNAKDGGTLKQIAEAIEQTAKNKRINVLNTYQSMPLCVNTMGVYFDETSGDRTHLNSKGNALYAHLINGKLKSMF